MFDVTVVDLFLATAVLLLLLWLLGRLTAWLLQRLRRFSRRADVHGDRSLEEWDAIVAADHRSKRRVHRR
jgi:hypothetical protein